jgi:hypothetical protein
MASRELLMLDEHRCKGVQLCILMILMICTMSVASCVHHEKYPDNWKPLSLPLEGKCDISGTYVVRSEGATDYPYRPFLDWCLFPEHLARKLTGHAIHATHATLSQNGDESIEFTAWKNDRKVASGSLVAKDGDYTCENGWITIKGSRLGTEVLVTGKEWYTRRFVKSGGSLIVKSESEVAAAIVVIPFVVRNSRWLRFKEIKPE